MYVGVVLRKGVRFRRIDVAFDRYRTVYKIRNTKKKDQNPYSQLEE
jgi:DNA relaxase NicK